MNEEEKCSGPDRMMSQNSELRFIGQSSSESKS